MKQNNKKNLEPLLEEFNTYEKPMADKNVAVVDTPKKQVSTRLQDTVTEVEPKVKPYDIPQTQRPF